MPYSALSCFAGWCSSSLIKCVAQEEQLVHIYILCRNYTCETFAAITSNPLLRVYEDELNKKSAELSCQHNCMRINQRFSLPKYWLIATQGPKTPCFHPYSKTWKY
jgi:1,4-dihydroxy-2-naphthoyl-CoA synthase